MALVFRIAKPIKQFVNLPTVRLLEVRLSSLGRKGEEAMMAFILESRFGKADIMNAYINEISLGQDGGRAIHGFGLASQFYFGKPLAELDLTLSLLQNSSFSIRNICLLSNILNMSISLKRFSIRYFDNFIIGSSSRPTG